MLTFNSSTPFYEGYLSIEKPYQGVTKIVTASHVEISQALQETRRAISSYEMRSFSINPVLLSGPDMTKVAHFFQARRGKLQGFRFFDLSNHSLSHIPVINHRSPNELSWVMGGLLQETFGDTQGRIYQIRATVSKEGLTEYTYKPIFKIREEAVSVFHLPSMTKVDVYIDRNTGVVAIPPAYSISEGFGVTCEFDTPVRFDSNSMEFTTKTVGRSGDTFIQGGDPVEVKTPLFSDTMYTDLYAVNNIEKATLEQIQLQEILPNLEAIAE